jgi:hypothetical protein
MGQGVDILTHEANAAPTGALLHKWRRVAKGG